MKRVLFYSNDRVSSSMAGPGIRYWELAHELANEFDVTLAVPYECDLVSKTVSVLTVDPAQALRLARLARSHDVLVTQRLPIATIAALEGSATSVIYDLYAPMLIENIAQRARGSESRRSTLDAQTARIAHAAAIATGDAFICASEKQRDFWLGSLAEAGRVSVAEYRRDPSLRQLIDVVPYGVSANPPERGAPVLKGVVPGIGATDRVILWGGGIWSWFDPLTVIRAVAKLGVSRSDVRLFFLGTVHPNSAVGRMAMTDKALELAADLGVRDRLVFFNETWVAYADRGRYLLESDIGVSAHFDDIETRLAFRTRLLDYIWAGLPIAATRGDAISDLLVARGIGRVLDFGDVDGWVTALDELLSNRPRLESRQQLEALRTELSWERAAKALARTIRSTVTAPAHGRRGATVRALAADTAARTRLTLHHRGPTGAARHQLHKLVRRRR